MIITVEMKFEKLEKKIGIVFFFQQVCGFLEVAELLQCLHGFLVFSFSMKNLPEVLLPGPP